MITQPASYKRGSMLDKGLCSLSDSQNFLGEPASLCRPGTPLLVRIGDDGIPATAGAVLTRNVQTYVLTVAHAFEPNSPSDQIRVDYIDSNGQAIQLGELTHLAIGASQDLAAIETIRSELAELAGWIQGELAIDSRVEWAEHEFREAA